MIRLTRNTPAALASQLPPSPDCIASLTLLEAHTPTLAEALRCAVAEELLRRGVPKASLPAHPATAAVAALPRKDTDDVAAVAAAAVAAAAAATAAAAAAPARPQPLEASSQPPARSPAASPAPRAPAPAASPAFAAVPPSAAVEDGGARRARAAARAALVARVASFCDASSAALALERSAERAAFDAAVGVEEKAHARSSSARARGGGDGADAAAPAPSFLLPQPGDAPGPRLLRGLSLVSSVSSSSGRGTNTVCVRPAAGGPLPPHALVPGDAVSLRAADASGAEVSGRLVEVTKTSATLVLHRPTAASGGAAADLAADASTTAAAPQTAPLLSGSDLSRALRGRPLVLAAAPDGVTHGRCVAALEQLRAIPARGKTPPPCAPIVAAMFPDPEARAAAAAAAAAQPSAHASPSPSPRRLSSAAAPPPGPLAALMAVGDTACYESLAGGYAALASSRLDASQRAAGASALARSVALTVVEGPPGTGKSALIAAVVGAACARGERVLIAAPANAGVDALATRLATRAPTAGLNMVRLGDASGLGEDLGGALGLHAVVASRLGGAAIGSPGNAALRAELKRLRERAAAAGDESGAAAAKAALARLARGARAAEAATASSVLRDAQVVLCTCAGAGDGVLAGAGAGCDAFDLVIVDEAGQATLPLGWLPLLRGKRALLVGDSQQLPPLVVSPAALDAGLGVSLLSAASAAAQPMPLSRGGGAGAGATASGAALRTALSVQYRCHGAIAGWANAASYGGRLATAHSAAARTLSRLAGVVDSPLTRAPMCLVSTRTASSKLSPGYAEAAPGASSAAAAGTAPPPPNGGSLVNVGEAAALVAHAKTLLAHGVDPSRMVALSPYAAQVGLLRSELSLLGIEASTVDAFQGRDADAVLISCCRANERGDGRVGFLADARRMNVAVTRARCHVALFADPLTVSAGSPFLAALLEAAKAAAPWGSELRASDIAAGKAPWEGHPTLPAEGGPHARALATARPRLEQPEAPRPAGDDAAVVRSSRRGASSVAAAAEAAAAAAAAALLRAQAYDSDGD